MGSEIKKLRTAIVGCGRISIMYFTALPNSKTAELVACCDIKKDLADNYAKQYGINAYVDYKEMFDKEKLDAVYICLPHYLHAVVSIDAFNKGINVLCEKPMSTDFESAKKAVEVAKSKNLLYGIISQCRYGSPAQLVKRVMQSGKLGKILSCRSILTWSRPDEYYSQSDWKGTWDKEGGGVIIDQAIHSIDLVNWIVNSEIECVSCSMSNRGHSTIEVEDSAEGLVTYKNGTKYSFYAMNNYGSNEPIEIRMLCENGRVVFGYDDAYIYFNDGTTQEEHKKAGIQAVTGSKDYWGTMHEIQIEQFNRACLNIEPLEISGEEALKTHKLIMEIYKNGGMKNENRGYN